jgi:hypothetical protein
MPDPSHRPYQPMTIIRPDSLPRLWWLFPWSIARQLHKNAVAIRKMADNQSTTITNQANILGRYMDENRELKAEVTRLSHSREHWIAKHDRAYAVAMHNERVIADLESRIIRGAITPDAHPHE